ncbi:MAG: 3-isopropylmalate dehydratase large subunit [Actinomycetota bacterium]|nr:3-isopropylmalate dehydratase large subunit [Actinomycetota bacterium]MDI6821599.1 3-isopropylmalate dehydratase large subunit [Actinomycetota bacterium]
MGMTITEKILAVHASKREVSPGELINVKLDVVLGNDVTTPLAIEGFKKIGVSKVFDPNKVVLVPDHYTPNRDIKAAEQCKILRNFAHEQGLTHYYEVGRMGIEHALLPEEGLVLPGEVIIGADSHTCTYGALGAFATGVGSTDMAAGMALGELWFKVSPTIKFVYYGKLNDWVTGKDLILYTIGRIGVDGALYRTLEFCGEVISNLSMDSRFTMANMAIEAGAKSGIIEPDQITLDYVNPRARRPFTVYKSDEDANYERTFEFDVSRIEPQVAFPHLPSNVKPISEVGDVPIDQVVIGSCTNGRLEDLRIAARILRGREVYPKVRLIIIPATQGIYAQAIREGLIEVFISAGAAVSTPTCGPCLGGHMGVLAEGERALATTNRNFVGRMGHPKSEVYLCGPAVAAASAVLGKIAGPNDL